MRPARVRHPAHTQAEGVLLGGLPGPVRETSARRPPGGAERARNVDPGLAGVSVLLSLAAQLPPEVESIQLVGGWTLSRPRP